MQYADIVVDHQAGYAPFTYSITPNLLAKIAIGSIVLVPVGKHMCHGVIIRFTKRIEPKVAHKLKSIYSVVYQGDFVPKHLITTAFQLQKKYGYGLNSLLFYLLPPLPKREQTLFSYETKDINRFSIFSYILPITVRLKVYEKLFNTYRKVNLSLLIVTSTLSAAQSLSGELKKMGYNVTSFPHDRGEKQLREYFLSALQVNVPTIFIGTRGAIKTPLIRVGGIVVDEPWFPGHKEERAPRLWTPLIAAILCRSRGIPLYLSSSVYWPESVLLGLSRNYIASPSDGRIIIQPNRSLHETLVHFLSQLKLTYHSAVIVKESRTQVYYCPSCQKVSQDTTNCSRCNNRLKILPSLSMQIVTDELKTMTQNQKIAVYTAEELLQYTKLDALCVLGYDAYFAISDYRASLYLASLTQIMKSRSSYTYLSTDFPDTWSNLLSKSISDLATKEIKTRKSNELPPYSIAVRIQSKKESALNTVIQSFSDSTLKRSKVQRNGEFFSVSLLLKRNIVFPKSVFAASVFKVDILPSYIG